MRPVTRYYGVNSCVLGKERKFRARLPLGDGTTKYGVYRDTPAEASADYVRLHQEVRGRQPDELIREEYDDDAGTTVSLIDQPWMACSAEQFIHDWLPRFESGELIPAPRGNLVLAALYTVADRTNTGDIIRY